LPSKVLDYASHFPFRSISREGGQPSGRRAIPSPGSPAQGSVGLGDDAKPGPDDRAHGPRHHKATHAARRRALLRGVSARRQPCQYGPYEKVSNDPHLSPSSHKKRAAPQGRHLIS
jgi:hypothetical protein